ncbi:MAG: family permease [Naasia sp.]|nr:family permease [Naasia sp.]
MPGLPGLVPGWETCAVASALRRELGTGDAVAIGLAAMVGAGVFTVFAPAAAAAGGLLLLALAVAAVVAFCNAASTAQLAAAHPVAGGAYAYGRAELGPWAGFLAGWAFVVGKTASIAAMALTFAVYVAPGPWQRPVALAALAGLTALTLFGVTRTARAARVLVALAVAGIVLALGAALPGFTVSRLALPAPSDAYGVLQGAALIFFAFAGYARIATLGEEVRDPARTIPRAIGAAFVLAVALYAAVAVVLLGVLGGNLPASTAPLADAAGAAGAKWALPAVALAAAVASLGSLLTLLAGVGRTALAMARERELPIGLAAVSGRTAAPWAAQLAVAVAAAGLLLAADLRVVIGFSSFGVLLYYAVANLAALRQRSAQRYPRAIPVVGLAGCLALAATVPAPALVAGVAVLLVGALGRLVALARRGRASEH